jgi:hypothetical protein
MPNEAAEAMRTVVSSAAPTLESAGFRKRRQTFNRSNGRGITQVVAFQLIPAERRRAGSDAANRRRFSISVGLANGAGEGAWVNEPDCGVRRDVAELVPPGHDAHPALDDVDGATWETFHLLTMYALPWLEEQRTVDG